ncbi:unnamed protein product [Camellia sinensis]
MKMASIPLVHSNPSKPTMFTLNSNSRESLFMTKLSQNSFLNSNSLSVIVKRQSCFVTKLSKSNGGSLSAFACSTSSPFIGRVGLQRREGNFSLLSFGTNPSHLSKVGLKTDSSQILSAMLPFVVALTAIAALTQPSTFTWVSKELYAPALGGIMLSIGIRLSIDDFYLAYMLKPALGVLVARAFHMSPMFYAGFVLMSCVAGAQLSNYASFLSKGDVALSIILTSSTTIASVLVTPLLTGLLVGSVVPIDAVAMSKSILQVVLVPVTLGLLLNTYAKSVVNILQPVMPFVAMICTSMCIGSPLAINRSHILSTEGLQLVLPVLTFHAVAFTLGYLISKIPLLSARRRSLQNNFIVHGNAEFDIGRASCHPIPWEQSSGSLSMLGSCHGYHGPLSCIFLGQWLSNQRPTISFHPASWLYCQGLVEQLLVTYMVFG